MVLSGITRVLLEIFKKLYEFIDSLNKVIWIPLKNLVPEM